MALEYCCPLPALQDNASAMCRDWNEFRQKFLHECVTESSDPDQCQIFGNKTESLLLYLGGQIAIELLNSSFLGKGSDDLVTGHLNIGKIFEKLEDECLPKLLTLFTRFKFFSCKQMKDESVCHFLAKLHWISALCEFNVNDEDVIIKDQILKGVFNDSLRQYLKSFDSLDRKAAERICRQEESSCCGSCTCCVENNENSFPRASDESRDFGNQGVNDVILMHKDTLETGEGHSAFRLDQGIGENLVKHTQSNDPVSQMKERNGNEHDSLSYFDVFIVESSTTSANEENVERDEDGEIIALYDKVTKNRVKSRKADGEKLMMGLKQTKRQDDNLLALIKEENVYICDDVIATVKEVSQYQSPVHATKKSAKRTKSDNIQPMLNIVKETLNGREDKILFCKICGKSFLYSWERDQHKCKIHPEQVSYRCDLCNSTFMFRSSLDEHLLSHTTDKMVSCDKCSAKFKDLKSLDRHLQQNHKGDRYPCKVCGKAFPYQWELKMHQMKKHTGERPFVCEVCGASFFVRSALGRHMQLHSGDHPFKCSYCAKTFTLRGHLNAHIRTHTGERPFMCHYCGTSYMKSADLLYHLRTHTGERPFKCATCGLAYFRPEHLRRHKTVHTGGDYTCNVCGAKFTRATTLRCHQKKIHGMVATAESGYQ